MKLFNLILKILALLFLLVSCKNTEPTPKPQVSTGKIAFYTNAQELLDGNSIQVNVYIDSTLVGTITTPCIVSGKTIFNSSDSILIVEKAIGTHFCYAKAMNNNTAIWRDTINVLKDSVQGVFFDAWKYASEITKTKIKIIGTWEDYMYEGNKVVFTKTDSVYEYTYSERINHGTYKVSASDSIETVRHPINVDILSKHKLIFTGNDTLRIKKFTMVMYDWGYADIYLKRVK